MPSLSSPEVALRRRAADGGRLFATLDALAPAEGINEVADRPTLAVHRICRLASGYGVEFISLSVGFIVQPDGTAHYAVGTGGAELALRPLAGAPRYPLLCCVVGIDPQLVRSTCSNMYPFSVARASADRHAMALSALDVELSRTVVGLLASMSSSCDRRVLAPLRMHEMIYRLLQREHRTRLLQLATEDAARDPVAAVIDYIGSHLSDPLPIEALAARVSLSPSAFSRAFRGATGRPPHRYIKECRLDKARELFDDGAVAVSVAAGAVGYASVSHFIKEFHARFGTTPGEYAEAAQQRWQPLHSRAPVIVN